MNPTIEPTKWGCIADDYTGATDLAGLIRRSGLSVIQCFGIPEAPMQLDQYDVIVVALKSRSIAPDDARESSMKAARWLAEEGVGRLFFKYCSTFDSTPHGNIGPVADALAEWTGSAKTLFCPSFPENGRTVYQGHLFVGERLLNESGMENHPLNPMDDANLVRVLTSQSGNEVGLLALAAITGAGEDRAKLDAHIRTQPPFLIADAITNDDLDRLARWAIDQPFVTGGSAIAGAMAARMTEATTRENQVVKEPFSRPSLDDPAVVIAGSCSLATQRQVAEFASRHPSITVDATAVMTNYDDELQRCAYFLSKYARRQTCMISSTADAASVANVSQHHDQVIVARRIEGLLSELAGLARQNGVKRFVVAGGETSGAVVKHLGIQAIEIGSEIAPGVPWTRSLSINPISLALKSGNFGSEHFFEEALGIRS